MPGATQSRRLALTRCKYEVRLDNLICGSRGRTQWLFTLRSEIAIKIKCTKRVGTNQWDTLCMNIYFWSPLRCRHRHGGLENKNWFCTMLCFTEWETWARKAPVMQKTCRLQATPDAMPCTSRLVNSLWADFKTSIWGTGKEGSSGDAQWVEGILSWRRNRMKPPIRQCLGYWKELKQKKAKTKQTS